MGKTLKPSAQKPPAAASDAQRRYSSLVQAMRLLEEIAPKIHGLLTPSEIYRTVAYEFGKSKEYSCSILLLTQDKQHLCFEAASVVSKKLEAAEKLVGRKREDFLIPLATAHTYARVVQHNEIVLSDSISILKEIFPSPLKKFIPLVAKMLGYEKGTAVLPIRMHNSVIGVIGITPPEMTDDFIPSARAFCHQISAAIELAQEHVERRRMEESLRESRERTRQFFENSLNLCYMVSPSGIILDANKTALSVLGYEKQELVGAPVKKIYASGSLERIQFLFEQWKQTGVIANEELTVVSKNGEERTVLLNVEAVRDKSGRIIHSVSVQTDITERKRVEERLLREQKRISSILAGITDTFYSLDTSWRFTVVNPAAEKAPFGRPASALLGKVIWDLYPGLLGTNIHQHYLNAAANLSLEHYEAQSPLNKRWYEVFMQGWEGGVDVYMRDITERRQAEEALRKSETQLSNALAMGRMGYWELDVASGMFTFSDSFYAVFKTTASRMGGYQMSIEDYTRHFVHPEDAYQVGEETRKALEATEPHFSRYLEHRMRYADGSPGHIAVRFFIVKDANGKTIKTYGVNQDITERKRSEEALQQAEKLTSIGVLAGGIAHDFNNFLQSVFGYLDIIRHCLDKGDVARSRDLLAKTTVNLERARSLTQQLLTFSKGGAPVLKPERIDALLAETVSFALSGSNITPQLDIPAELWPCNIDAHQIAQAIDNLIINARHAMPLGGTIEITAQNLPAEQAPVSLPRNNFVKISIRDHGQGIAPEHLAHIFVPFFTTKASGSGLGLATCYSIIKKHEGFIDVESELGKGTVFHMYIPASDKASVKSAQRAQDPVQFHGNLLLLDDEEAIRDAMAAVLTGVGFTVSAAANADEAISFAQQAKKSGQPFTIAILDLTIPGGRGGKEVVRELAIIDPAIKTIASSGYTEDPILAEPQAFGFSGAIAKPYSMTHLEPILKKLMDIGP